MRSCAQLFIYSTGGNAKPSSTVSIPGYANAKDPGVLFDYWNNMKPKTYKIPGPAPYVKTNAGGGKAIKVPFNPHPQYKECLVKNANWCAVSLPAYTNEDSCWKVKCPPMVRGLHKQTHLQLDLVGRKLLEPARCLL
jgi:hypothetical protein